VPAGAAVLLVKEKCISESATSLASHTEKASESTIVAVLSLDTSTIVKTDSNLATSFGLMQKVISASVNGICLTES